MIMIFLVSNCLSFDFREKMLIKVYSYNKSIFIAHIVEGLCVYFLRLYAIFQCPYNVTFISLPL